METRVLCKFICLFGDDKNKSTVNTQTLITEIKAPRRQTQEDSERDLNNVSERALIRVALWWINIKDAHLNEGMIYKLENL